MNLSTHAGTALVLGLLASSYAAAQADAPAADGVYIAGAVTQTQADEYTRYELLAPESGSFRIYYEVSATTAGAKVFYNPIRKGSTASDESVLDAASSGPLHFEVVSGLEARKDPLLPDADPGTSYIKVTLARPVPKYGAGRMIIIKTYHDPKSYYLEGKTLVFNRPLSIRRNKVVLPAGYEVTGLTVPSQILTEADGRVAISFMHEGGGEAPLSIRAARDAPIGAAGAPHGATDQRSWESPFQGETERARLTERAHLDRSIVYFLQQPQSHAFRAYYEVTESRPGVNAYVNVVRAGSVATDITAMELDTGETLKASAMNGAQLAALQLNVGQPIDPNSRVIVAPFETVKPGESRRLRIMATYTTQASYRLDGDELVFDRRLGQARNAVVLPSGWYCTASAAPTTVTQLPDGRVRLDYWDGQAEAVDVLLKARRRTGAD
jgi:hypothetical protein